MTDVRTPSARGMGTVDGMMGSDLLAFIDAHPGGKATSLLAWYQPSTGMLGSAPSPSHTAQTLTHADGRVAARRTPENGKKGENIDPS